MNNENDTYRSLFNDDIISNQITDFSNNLTIKFNQIDSSFNIVDMSYNFIITKFNDYYNKNWYDLSYNFLNTKFNNYYDKNWYDLSYNFLNTKFNNYYDKNWYDLSYNFLNTKFNNYYDKSTSDGKYALITSLNTTNLNVSTLQSYFTSNKLNLINLFGGNYGTGNNYLVLCSVPDTVNNVQILQYQQIGDSFIAGGIQQSKILNLVSTLASKVDTTTLTSNYSTTTTNDSRYLRTGQNIDISTYNFTTSGTINATTGNLKCNNLSSHNSTNIAIGSGLDLQNTYKIINSANATNNGDLMNKLTCDNTYLSKSQYNTDNANYTYDYFYNTLMDTTTGLMRLNSLVPPSSNGTYYLKCIRSAGPINAFSWGDVNTLSFSPFATFQGTSQNNWMELQQAFSPVGQTSAVAIEYKVSNTYNASYVASIGFNSSGYFGAINYSNPYGYVYSGARLRLMCINNSSAVDTAILCEGNLITMYRNLTLNNNTLTCGTISSTSINTNNSNIQMGSGSLTLTGSISSGGINTNNNNINFGTASCFGNNYVNASGGASYHPQGWTCNNTSSMGNFRITNLSNGTSGTDAVNLNQLNSTNVSTDRITTSTSGIADGVRLVRGPGGTGDVSIFADNGTSTLLWNGWGRCGLRSTHTTQTFQNRFTIANDRFAFIMGNDTTSGQNPGSYLSEWYYYNTLRCYISNGGTFTNSDKDMKHSFRNKSDIYNLNNKNYLDRILKLPIYSYAFNNCDDNHCNSELYVGPLYQDVKEIFNNNCVGNRKYLENYKCKEDCGTCKRRKEYYGEEVKTISASEISYYHILAFQEYVYKTDKLINDLNNKYDELNNKFNLLLNKLNLTI